MRIAKNNIPVRIDVPGGNELAQVLRTLVILLVTVKFMVGNTFPWVQELIFLNY